MQIFNPQFRTFRRAPWALVIISFVMVLVFTGCGGGGEDGAQSATEGPIKMGAIFDLTGPTSDVGTTYSEGLRGYVTWRNQNGGVAGRQIDLLYQDYGYKVDQAEQLYSQFVNEGAVAFMGWGTGDTEALRGRIAEDKIPFMSASLSHVLGDPAEAPYNFLSATSYSDQLRILLDWILESEPVTSVALMHSPTPFGLSPYQQGGKEYAESKGVSITAVEMPRGSTDYTAQLTRIAEAGTKWVLFQNTSAPVATAIKNAADLRLDLNFACLNWCSNEVLTTLAESAAEGVLGSILFAPQVEGVDGLADAAAFLESQGSSLEEKGLLYGQGWWTMGLMLEGVERAAKAGPVTGATIKQALESLDNFGTGGVTAPVTYTSTNHRGVNGMRIFKVEGGKWIPATGLRFAEN